MLILQQNLSHQSSTRKPYQLGSKACINSCRAHTFRGRVRGIPPKMRMISKILAVAATESIDDTTQQVIDNLLNTFHSADTNKDGVLDRDELRVVLERVGCGTEPVPLHWVTDDDLDSMIQQYDTNKDGVISYEEFQILAQDKAFLSAALKDYRAAFNAIDSGGNGKIGPTELLKLFKQLDSPLQTYDKIVHLMKEYDVNKDGEIDFGEFLRLCRFEKALPLEDILKYASIKTEGHNEVILVEPPTIEPGTVGLFTSEAEFKALSKAHPDTLIVLLASLTWCRPCKKVIPALNKCAAAYAGNKTLFLRFNGNENEDTKSFFKNKLKVRVTPSFFFFNNGELIGSCTGANSSRLEDNLRMNLEKSEVSTIDLPERLYDPLPAVEES